MSYTINLFILTFTCIQLNITQYFNVIKQKKKKIKSWFSQYKGCYKGYKGSIAG